MEGREVQYNRAKIWQIALFACNNVATNLYLFLFGFISYYATGIAGLTVMLISTIVMAMRLWDGVTDPIIGYLIDKTDGKLGKFRPFMIIGNVMLAITSLILYKTTHLVPENLRVLYFILVYAVYIIGYTFQTAVTKSGQTVLTNDPSQRPKFTLFDSIYNTILFVGGQMLVSQVLVPKHDGFNMSFFNEFLALVIILSGILTALAIVGIWEKDRSEYFMGKDQKRLTFKDYKSVLKGNRALQMLVVAASTDKLAGQVAKNAVVPVILYGILIGDYGLSGSIGMITIIPTLIITAMGVRLASKKGLKKALVGASWLSIIITAILFVFLRAIDMTKISLTNMNIITIAFIVIMIIREGSMAVSNGVVIPMIADCSDYETYRSGNYIPGVIGTLFSFVDKLISSLASTIVGAVLAAVGFKTVLPQVGDPATATLFYVAMFLFLGVPVLGWIASVIAMKFYPLDDVKMVEVQAELNKRSFEKEEKVSKESGKKVVTA